MEKETIGKQDAAEILERPVVSRPARGVMAPPPGHDPLQRRPFQDEAAHRRAQDGSPSD